MTVERDEQAEWLQRMVIMQAALEPTPKNLQSKYQMLPWRTWRVGNVLCKYYYGDTPQAAVAAEWAAWWGEKEAQNDR